MEVIGESITCADAVALAARVDADVAVLDSRLPGDPLGAVAAIAGSSTTGVMVLAGECNPVAVVEAVALGAEGYVLKTEPLAVIVGAIRRVAAGGRWFSAAAKDALVDRLRAGAPGSHVQLTCRELQILRLLAEGMSSDSIGRELHLSESTVKHHRAHLYAKLGVTKAAAAVYEGMRRGVLQ
jgi:DNA-binding NarL/FixJ family response regulator